MATYFVNGLLGSDANPGTSPEAPCKNIPALCSGLDTVYVAKCLPGYALTDREFQTAKLVIEGMANKEIGAVLGIEERTVKAYVAKLLRKFGARNRVGLAVRLSLTDQWRQGHVVEGKSVSPNA